MPTLTYHRWLDLFDDLATFAGARTLQGFDDNGLPLDTTVSSELEKVKRYGVTLTDAERAVYMRGLLVNGHSCDEGWLSDNGEPALDWVTANPRSHTNETIEGLARTYHLLTTDGDTREHSINQIVIDDAEITTVETKLCQAADQDKARMCQELGQRARQQKAVDSFFGAVLAPGLRAERIALSGSPEGETPEDAAALTRVAEIAALRREITLHLFETRGPCFPDSNNAMPGDPQRRGGP